MSGQRVTSSKRLWSQEVAEVRALTEMDRAIPAGEGAGVISGQRDVNYEFSNGRKFQQPTNPYE